MSKMADADIERMNNCPHSNPVQGANGILMCGDCGKEIYNPILDNVPTPPEPPTMIEKITGKSKAKAKAVPKETETTSDTSTAQGKSSHFGIKCPHCTKYIGVKLE